MTTADEARAMSDADLAAMMRYATTADLSSSWANMMREAAFRLEVRALSALPPAVAPQCPVDVANLLTDAASILDAARMDWGETWWSEFDQSVRDRITQYLQWHYAAPEKSNG